MAERRTLVTASAPGKVVLSGEYAVLVGAPAVCMAIDRRANVIISANNGDHHIVHAAGTDRKPCRFLSNDGVIEWIDAGDDFELLEAVWESMQLLPESYLSLRLDTNEFTDIATGNKTGIGSSAALAAALSAALAKLSSSASQANDIAFKSHHRFQRGRGSGVDIATSVTGGLIEYVMDGHNVRSLDWPDGLFSALIWSGEPASTTQKLDRLARSESRPSRAALVYSARRLAKAWRQGRVDPILNEYRDYTNVLQEFSVDHDLGIFDAGHAELVAAARDAGLVYKPCGAGGGDVGIALADDAAAVESFVGTALGANGQVLDARLDTGGMEAERTDCE